MRPSQVRNLVVLVVVVVLGFWGLSVAADFIIDYNWWKEVGPGRYLAQHVVVQHRALRRGRGGGVRGALGRALTRAGVCRHPQARFSAVLSLGSGGLGDRGAAVRFGVDRLLDGDALCRFAGPGAGRRRLEGSGFLASAGVLSLRSALLFAGAWICVCAGDSLRLALLGHGPGMAVVAARRVRQEL